MTERVVEVDVDARARLAVPDVDGRGVCATTHHHIVEALVLVAAVAARHAD